MEARRRFIFHAVYFCFLLLFYFIFQVEKLLPYPSYHFIFSVKFLFRFMHVLSVISLLLSVCMMRRRVMIVIGWTERGKSSHHLPSLFLLVVHTFVVVVAAASLTERRRGRGRDWSERKRGRGDQWSFDILLFSFLPYFYLPSVSNCLFFFLFDSFLDLSFSLFSSILLPLPSFQPTVSLSFSSLHSSHLFTPSLIHSQSTLINSLQIILIPQESGLPSLISSSAFFSHHNFFLSLFSLE